MLLSSPSVAQGVLGFPRDELPDYRLESSAEPALLALLHREIDTYRSKKNKPFNTSDTRSVARDERQLIKARLDAEGYYDHWVRYEMTGQSILYRVEPGEPYRIRVVTSSMPSGLEFSAAELPLKTGTRLRAEEVLNAKQRFDSIVAKRFCLYKIDARYDVKLDASTQSADVHFSLAESPEVTLGHIQFEGLKTVEESYLREQIDIKQGDCFKRSKIYAARLALIQTSLVSAVREEIGTPVDGQVAILFHLQESQHQTLSAGVGYQTDEGAGVSFGWEHRNLNGRGQRVQLDGYLRQQLQGIALDWSIPGFGKPDRLLTLYLDVANEQTDAFDAQELNLGADLNFPVAANWQASLGAELSFADVAQVQGEDSFALFSVPVTLEHDRRDNPLDPKRGWSAAAHLRPYLNLSGGQDFVKSTLAISVYKSLPLAGQPTLSLRTAMGTIEGADREQVPANERFYVGGGGSVRGYPFQTLGPLNNNVPQGGLSFSELSVEARVRWRQNWGAAVFFDGGAAYESSRPQLGENLRWATGLGLRYYTSFAPVRFDIAVPLDKRSGIDDPFQLYVSIGQSF